MTESIAGQPISARMRRWRTGLILGGAVLLTIGGALFLTHVPAARYPWVAAWLIGAIIVHDGIGAMAVFAITVLVRRFDGVIPWVVLAILQAAAAIGVIVAVLVGPEIVKQAIGTANPSILPLPYANNLVLFLIALAALTGIAVIGVLVVRRARRAGAPPPRRTG
jgi:hypothetical protein